MNTRNNQDVQVNGKTAIIVAIIAGLCTIISSIISSNIGKEKAIEEVILQASNNINISINSIDELITAYNQLSNDIFNLKDENLILEKQNTSLKNETESLKDELSQLTLLQENYDTLVTENNLLKSQISQYKAELETLKYNNTSSISELVAVPNVVGYTQEDAIDLLNNLNLGFQVWWYEEDMAEDVGKKCYVAEQSIPENSRVEAGTVIKLRLVTY